MKCIVFPDQQEIEVAPGERYVDVPPDIVPKIGIVRWTPAGDGTYKPRVQVMENWIRVTEATRFGIHIKRETLIRLGTSGFISSNQPSPGMICISLDSLLEHIELCKDPEFWTEKRRTEYRKALPIFRET